MIYVFVYILGAMLSWKHFFNRQLKANVKSWSYYHKDKPSRYDIEDAFMVACFTCVIWPATFIYFFFANIYNRKLNEFIEKHGDE